MMRERGGKQTLPLELGGSTREGRGRRVEEEERAARATRMYSLLQPGATAAEILPRLAEGSADSAEVWAGWVRVTVDSAGVVLAAGLVLVSQTNAPGGEGCRARCRAR